MKVRKFKHTLHLKLEKDEDTIKQFLHASELFNNDLIVYLSQVDGWIYLYDANRDAVYRMNGYYHSFIHDLLSGKLVIADARPNDETYADYEWNEE